MEANAEGKDLETRGVGGPKLADVVKQIDVYGKSNDVDIERLMREQAMEEIFSLPAVKPRVALTMMAVALCRIADDHGRMVRNQIIDRDQREDLLSEVNNTLKWIFLMILGFGTSALIKLWLL